MSYPLHRVDGPPGRTHMGGDAQDVDGGTGDGLLRPDQPRIPAALDVRVDVFVRSLAPAPGLHGQQVAIVESLNELADAGGIADATVSIWGERLCPCETCRETGAGRAVLDRVRAIEAWAAAVSAAVTVPFERRSRDCGFTGAKTTVIVPPRITIVIYGDATLLGVFPCEVDGESISVAEGLERLRKARRADAAAVPGGGDVSDPDADRRGEHETRLS